MRPAPRFSFVRSHCCAISLRVESMTMCSRILRHWNVNDLINDATPWMDNEMCCDLTWVLMPHLSRCGSSVHVTIARGNLEHHKETNRHAQLHKNAQQLRRDCALTSTSTLWICRPDSHKLMPETRGFPQVKVPSTAPFDEARKWLTCRHSSEELSKDIQMFTRSELSSHRNAKFNSRFPCLPPDVIKQLDSSCPLDVWVECSSTENKKISGINLLSPRVHALDTVKFVAENVPDSQHSSLKSRHICPNLTPL